MTEKQQDVIEAMTRAIWQQRIDRGSDPQSFLTFDELPDSIRQDLFAEARAALSAIKEAGYVLAPVEATEEMIEVVIHPMYRYGDYSERKRKARDLWRAMLSAIQPVEEGR